MVIRHSLFILLLAFALNLHGLAADSFWGDEILTAMFARQSPAEVIRWTAGDIHPPLYYLAAGAFTRLTAGQTPPGTSSDWLWRFPSAAAVVLAVAATLRLALHMLPATATRPGTATSAMLLLAVSPLAIKYGQEARMHALFLLLAALSSLLLFRAMRRPRRWTRWLAYALALTATLYTMYFGFLILATQGLLALAVMLQQRSTPGKSAIKPIFAGFSLAALGAFLLYLPWWPVLLDILRRRAAVGAIEGGVGNPLAFVAGVVEALGPPPLPVAWLFFGLYLLGLVLLARRRWPVVVFAGAWLALPTLLPLLLGDPRALQFRYAFILPVYLTVIAFAVWHTAGQLPLRQSAAAVARYAVWILVTVSVLGTLGVFAQTKPDWRGAAAYLDAHTQPADIILIGPLWDEGRFVDYYTRGQAQLLTPAALVTNIEGRVGGLREAGGRIWAINRFAPAETPALQNVSFSGVVVSEPTLAVYEPDILRQGALDLAAQAVDAAYPWADAAQAQGVLDPDPRTARAAALRALGDTLLAAGQPDAALEPYQTAVDIFPGWVGGYLALAEAQQAAGNLPDAVAAYRQAVKFNLAWHGPQAEHAAGLADSGNWPAALDAYRQLTGN